MRVLTVTHFYEAHGGGIERVAGQLCRQFARLGSCAVWAASNADEPPGYIKDTLPLKCANPIERLTGLPMPIPSIGSIRALSNEIERSDAVIIHDALYVTSIVAMLISKARRKHVILVQHIAAIPFSSRALRFIMRIANVLVTKPMLAAADDRVFISDNVRRELVGDTPRYPSELLFNGVDHAMFYPADRRNVPDVVQRIGRLREGRRVLFAGRYVGKKGLGVIQRLATLRPDLTIFLAGSGPIRPSNWNLDNVYDLGPQPSHVLAELYRWADLLILPSVGEGYPLVIQEAMACGLPVICGSPCESADPEAIRWLRGVSIDLNNLDASAERCSLAIDRLSLSMADRERMARFAARRYNWGKMAERLLTLANRSNATL